MHAQPPAPAQQCRYHASDLMLRPDAGMPLLKGGRALTCRSTGIAAAVHSLGGLLPGLGRCLMSQVVHASCTSNTCHCWLSYLSLHSMPLQHADSSTCARAGSIDRCGCRAKEILEDVAAAGRLGDGAQGAKVVYAQTDSLFAHLPNATAAQVCQS